MTALRVFFARFRGLFTGASRDRELAEEIEAHLDLLIADHMRQGMSRDEATAAARRDFGGVESIKDTWRDQHAIAWILDVGRDVRLAIRGFRRTPAFFIVAVSTLALTIGSNAAMFSLVNSLLLKPLPVARPDQLVLLTNGYAGRASYYWNKQLWDEVRQRRELFDGAAAWNSTRFDLSTGTEPDIVDGLWVSGSFFRFLGVAPAVGRMLTEQDDQAGGGPAGPVAVISYRFWQSRFNRSPEAIGQAISIGGVSFRIVGVTPSGFFGAEVGHTFDLAAPIADEAVITGILENGYWLNILARLKSGQTVAEATAALRAVQPQIQAATLPAGMPPAYRERYLKDPFGVVLAEQGYSTLRDQYQRPLLIILATVGFVLLIGCANIANLMLARASERHREMSTRVALGASRVRLVRQLLAESLLLALAGGILGLVLAVAGSRFLASQLSNSANVVFLDLQLDWRVLLFTLAASLSAAVLFGLGPAFTASAAAPMDALKDGGHGVLSRRRALLPNALIAAQVALALILAVAAGLFVRTFATLATRDSGLDPGRVLLARIDSTRARMDTDTRFALYERTQTMVRRLSGVDEAAFAAITPIGGGGMRMHCEAEDGNVVPDMELTGNCWENFVSPGWFAALGIRLIAGRDVTEADRKGAPMVAVVNETFARAFFSGRNPIGHAMRQFMNGPTLGPPIQIVGVVANATYNSLRDDVPPTAYLSLPQAVSMMPPPVQQTMTLHVRAAGNAPLQLTRSVAAAVHSVDPRLALTFRAMSEQVGASLTRERLVAELSGFFGALAILLAALGVFGVTAYSVQRRRPEIGMRIALGESPQRVTRRVVGRVAVVVAVGVIAGGIVTMWAGRAIASLLYQLDPWDRATFAAAALVLTLTAGVAAWLPARRASRVDPAVALRYE